MNEATGNASAKPARRRWVVLTLLAFLLGAAAVWLVVSDSRSTNNDRHFRGKPEAAWIKELKYNDDDQVKEWRSYGEEGVQVLIRGLQQANHSGERLYRDISGRLPGFVMRWLPSPKDDSTRSTRMCLASLLSSLGNDATSATPIMIRTANRDEDDSVRQCAINFFTTNEDEKCLLNQLPAEQKKKLLPGLIRDLQNPLHWGLRGNAANALRWFPEQREIVTPVLVMALQDPQTEVRLLAAQALNRVDPETAKRAGAVSVVIAITKNPDDQNSRFALRALRFFKADAELAVPTLIECLQHTNTRVASEAVRALEWAANDFGSYSNAIVPALEKTAERNDSVGKYARRAMKRWQSEPNTKEAVK